MTHTPATISNPLHGKHVIYLGSSVTYGAASNGVSFADYITARNSMTMTKEAISGTTLVDDAEDSYIARMKRLDPAIAADLFVCQLSTNDATQCKPLGRLADSFDYADFDTHTVAGAIEYIIAYARSVWHCPVAFYTNPRYSAEPYSAMVSLLHRIAGKWGVTVIDLWNDDAMNDITDAQRQTWMADSIHPTQAGYLHWWTPMIEKAIGDLLGK